MSRTKTVFVRKEFCVINTATNYVIERTILLLRRSSIFSYFFRCQMYQFYSIHATKLIDLNAKEVVKVQHLQFYKS